MLKPNLSNKSALFCPNCNIRLIWKIQDSNYLRLYCPNLTKRDHPNCYYNSVGIINNNLDQAKQVLLEAFNRHVKT